MPVEESSREKVFAAEKGIASIRVAVILLNSLVYHFMMDKAGTVEWLAYTVIVVANAYGLIVFLGRPYERFPAMLSSLFTTVLDAVFITLWLAATGGIASPFYLLWFVSVTAVAFRYGLRETIIAAVVYALSYLGLLAARDEITGYERDVILRLAYLMFIAAIGGLLARETTQQTRAKNELRELAVLLKESEDRFRRLSDATFEGIAVHEHGRILECNKAFAAMLGYATAEVLGRSVFDFIAPASHAETAQRIRTASDQPWEAEARRKEGETIMVELVARDLPYGGRMARIVAVRDITARKRAEAEARERLALQAVNERLQAMDRLKTQFINNAAHELGTPLTPLKIQTHILKAGTLGPLNERQERAIDILARNIDHLAVLVRDVLDASRLQSGHLAMDPRETDLARLVHDAADSFVDAAAAQGVSLAIDAEAPLPVRADPARITQVLFNLVHNALKFTPQGGSIRVDAFSDAGMAVVEVEDTGAGIAAEDLAKLFRPFSQVHDRTLMPRAGTGLGLYVSKGIVQEHGGTLTCGSPGRGLGTTFRFTLPLAPPSA